MPSEGDDLHVEWRGGRARRNGRLPTSLQQAEAVDHRLYTGIDVGWSRGAGREVFGELDERPRPAPAAVRRARLPAPAQLRGSADRQLCRYFGLETVTVMGADNAKSAIARIHVAVPA